MELQIEPSVVQKIEAAKQPGDRMYLDFEDGAGPFQATAITCRLDISFRFILVPEHYPETGLSIYSTKLKTAVGDVWLKDGAEMYLEKITRMVTEPTYQSIQLKGDSGILAANVAILRIDQVVAGN